MSDCQKLHDSQQKEQFNNENNLNQTQQTKHCLGDNPVLVDNILLDTTTNAVKHVKKTSMFRNEADKSEQEKSLSETPNKKQNFPASDFEKEILKEFCNNNEEDYTSFLEEVGNGMNYPLEDLTTFQEFIKEAIRLTKQKMQEKIKKCQEYNCIRPLKSGACGICSICNIFDDLLNFLGDEQ